MSLTLEIGVNRASPLTLDESDIQSLNPVKTHSGVGDFSARIAGNRSVEDYAQRQDRINIKSDGTTFFTGFLLKVSHNKQRGTTRIQGRGIGKKLQETRPDYDALGGSLTYTNIALEDAIDNYWGRTPFSASVTGQNTSIVAQDDQLVNIDTTSEWQNNVPIASDQPFFIDSGKLKLAQSAFVREAEDVGQFGGVGIVSRSDYSDGEGYAVGKPGAGTTVTSFSFTTNYEISNPKFAVRVEETDTTISATDVLIDGNKEGNLGTSKSVEWQTTSLSNISAGSHTCKLEISFTPSNDAEYQMDVMAVYDTDYHTQPFDNTDLSTVSRNHLNDPKLYPDSAVIETQDYTTSLNIAEGDLSTTFDDTTENQQLGISFDQGGSLTRSSNTNNITATNNNASRNIRGEFTASRYPLGSNAQSATPRFGYKGQTIDSAEILVDTNDLTVIDELELSKNHFDNLQTLHQYGDFIWVIEHDDADISNVTVNSFQRGDETRTLPSLTTNDINKTPKIDSSQYYNSIFVQGAIVGGSRPTAEIKDSTAISNDRGEISPGVLRDLDILTEGAAEFRAQALLDKAQKNSALRGQKVTPAVDLSPGYAYAVDFGDGLTEFTAEEVSISKGTDRAKTTLDFIPRNDISQDIAELRRNARKTDDQV